MSDEGCEYTITSSTKTPHCDRIRGLIPPDWLSQWKITKSYGKSLFLMIAITASCGRHARDTDRTDRVGKWSTEMLVPSASSFRQALVESLILVVNLCFSHRNESREGCLLRLINPKTTDSLINEGSHHKIPSITITTTAQRIHKKGCSLKLRVEPLLVKLRGWTAEMVRRFVKINTEES